MSEANRGASIRSMVERFANCLTETPGDMDGWTRLANAYSVLGAVENAKGAYRTAERLAQGLPPDDTRKQTIEKATPKIDG